MFGELDRAVFLQDFGDACVKALDGTRFTGILDRPGEVIDVGGMPHLSDEYAVTFDPAEVTLARGDAVEIVGVRYTVRGAPRAEDDGLFMRASLNKV